MGCAGADCWRWRGRGLLMGRAESVADCWVLPERRGEVCLGLLGSRRQPGCRDLMPSRSATVGLPSRLCLLLRRADQTRQFCLPESFPFAVLLIESWFRPPPNSALDPTAALRACVARFGDRSCGALN